MTKMGSMAQNLAAAEQSVAPGSMLGTKLRIGRGMFRGTGHAARGLDVAAKSVGEALTAPGGELSSAAAHGIDAAYQGFRKSPLALKALGVGLPLSLLFQTQEADRLTPMFNNAIQEGRTVYANDQKFIEKKAELAKRMEKTAIDWASLLQGMAQPGHGGAAMPIKPEPYANPMLGALSSLAMGNSPSGPAGALMGGAMQGVGQLAGAAKGVIDPLMGTSGYRLNRAINPLTTRVRADELMATSFFNNIGSEVAKNLVGLLKDVATKAVTGASQAPVHRAMLGVIQEADPVLAKADPAELMSAYHTMAKFAPTMSTDENAVRSFLRQAADSAGGLDYATIANIAKAEAAITGK